MNKEELEQLKSTVKQWLFHTGSLDPTNYANELKLKFIEPREKRIAELEKENAELKHTIATLRQEKDNVSMHAKAVEVVAKTRSDQLTKAKELLKEFIFLLHTPRTALDTKTVMNKTEQFLNSEVEK